MDTTENLPSVGQVQVPEPPKQKSRKPLVVTIIILAVLLIALLGTAAGLYSAGKLSFSMTARTVADAQTGLCQNIIPSYNAGFKTTGAGEYEKSLKQAAERAKEADPANSDPTCVYMQFTSATVAQDIDEIKRLSGILEGLANKGAYITGELANPQGIESIKNTAQQLEDIDNPTPSDPTVQGNG